MPEEEGPVKRRVLVVDDDIRVCRLVARIARRLGLDAAEARSQSELHDALQRERPDLILLDLNLGSVAGAELLEGLAAAHTRVPIRFLTGSDSNTADAAETLGRALGLEISGTLFKPLDADRLQRLFEALMA